MEGLRKKFSIWALILVAVSLLVLSVGIGFDSSGVGPQGRAADLYLKIIHGNGDGRVEAETGLRWLGVSAMPTITNYLSHRDSWLRSTARALLEKQTFVKITIHDKFAYRSMARQGVQIIGTNAGPALVSMFRYSPIDYVGEDNPAYLAAKCLVNLGPPAILALVGGLTNGNARIRALSAMTITMSSNVRHSSVVPGLVRCAGDTNAEVRAAAVFALGRVMENPELSIPALAAGLRDTNSAGRFHSIHSLWAFGSHARAAIPAIEQAIKAEPLHPDAGFDQWELGPKSRDMILDALTNALDTIKFHVESTG